MQGLVRGTSWDPLPRHCLSVPWGSRVGLGVGEGVDNPHVWRESPLSPFAWQGSYRSPQQNPLWMGRRREQPWGTGKRDSVPRELDASRQSSLLWEPTRAHAHRHTITHTGTQAHTQAHMCHSATGKVLSPVSSWAVSVGGGLILFPFHPGGKEMQKAGMRLEGGLPRAAWERPGLQPKPSHCPRRPDGLGSPARTPPGWPSSSALPEVL